MDRRPRSTILTRRELDVVRFAAVGLTNKEIGARLSLHEGSIKTYMSRILMRVGLSNRFELIVWAISRKMVPGCSAVLRVAGADPLHCDFLDAHPWPSHGHFDESGVCIEWAG